MNDTSPLHAFIICGQAVLVRKGKDFFKLLIAEFLQGMPERAYGYRNVP